MNTRYLSIGFLLTVIVFGGAICNRAPKIPSTITLEYWTVEEDREAIDTMVKSFNVTYPYITVNITVKPESTYEDDLIQAWARGEGPDIFSVRNDHIGKFADLIQPMPSAYTLTEVTTSANPFGGTDVTTAVQTRRALTVDQLARIFPQTVREDAVLLHQGANDTQEALKIFGLPFSMDSLVMFYNKDLLNQARLSVPAATWDEFTQQVPRLTLVDVDNNIIQSGAAIGTGNNVNYADDLLALLMMQNGATMITGKDVQFARPLSGQRDVIPGVQAATFYTSFANPDVEWYSWDAFQPNSREAFITGKVAYYFGYYSDLLAIQKEGNGLNFDVAPTPQVNGDSQNDIAYAQYWLQSVAVNSPNAAEAWALLQAFSTEQARAQQYLDLTNRPAALLSLIDGQREDLTLATFADQSLVSKSWYNGTEPASVQQQFLDMILLINEGRLDATTAVQNTADKVELTL